MKYKILFLTLIASFMLSSCVLVEKDSIIYGATLTGELAYDTTQNDYLTIYNYTGEKIDKIYIKETNNNSTEPNWSNDVGSLGNGNYLGIDLISYTPGKTIWIKCFIEGEKTEEVTETDKYLKIAFQYEINESWILYVEKSDSLD